MIPPQETKQEILYSSTTEEYEIDMEFLEQPDYLTLYTLQDGECSLIGNENYTITPEGILTFENDDLSEGSPVWICLDIPIEQAIAFKKNETLESSTLEEAFDLQTLKLQEIEECLSRIPKLSPCHSWEDITPGTPLTVNEDGEIITT